MESVPKHDLAGRTFGDWVVLEYIGKSKWLCRCKCGAEKPVNGRTLKNGRSRSCHSCAVKKKRPHNFADLTGKRFGSWHVIGYHGDSKWTCRCECGSEQNIRVSHLTGGYSTRCLNCKAEHVNNTLRRKDFLESARSVHGSKYSYPNLKYINNTAYITIKCPEHGEFKQTPKNHLRGHGCPKCGNNFIGTEEFIRRARAIHGDKYDYSHTEYGETGLDDVEIRCPNHGIFLQCAYDHLQGNGCKKCLVESKRLSTEEFINRSSAVHSNKYDYSKTNYGDSGLDKVCIICPDHGEFWQRPDGHLYAGRGCPKCAAITSGPHQVASGLIPAGVKIVNNDRSVINPYEIDIWVPEHHLGIEIHGAYWHGLRDNNREAHRRLKFLHHIKASLASEVDINLLQLWEHEINEKPELVRSMIRHKLGISQKIYARKCLVEKLSNKSVSQFFSDNHMQGHRNASATYGLVYDNRIVCGLSFSRNRKYQWEIIRYACERGFTVVGGFSRLFKRFAKEHKPDSVGTFADRRFGRANLYLRNGFVKIEDTDPNYFYFKNNMVISRQRCQKHKLHKLLGESFDTSLTEVENMHRAGYTQVFDAGHAKLIWRRS